MIEKIRSIEEQQSIESSEVVIISGDLAVDKQMLRRLRVNSTCI